MTVFRSTGARLRRRLCVPIPYMVNCPAPLQPQGTRAQETGRLPAHPCRRRHALCRGFPCEKADLHAHTIHSPSGPGQRAAGVEPGNRSIGAVKPAGRRRLGRGPCRKGGPHGVSVVEPALQQSNSLKSAWICLFGEQRMHGDRSLPLEQSLSMRSCTHGMPAPLPDTLTQDGGISATVLWSCDRPAIYILGPPHAARMTQRDSMTWR